jgi:uncharacterized protein YhbP (UPF0306 family)
MGCLFRFSAAVYIVARRVNRATREIVRNKMKSSRKQLDLIATLLNQETTLSLATTGEDGEPSVAPLFYIAGQELSLYWLSSPRSLHSLNLARMPRVSAAVYRGATRWKEIRGIQMRGSVSKITEPNLRAPILQAYCERFKLGRVFRIAIRHSTLYLLQPDFFRYIDNAKAFGYKFELTRRPQGWTLAQPAL